MITVQPFGLPVTIARAGKWNHPKMFTSIDVALEYIQKWWVGVLDRAWSDLVPISAREHKVIPFLTHKEFNIEPHLLDISEAWFTPDRKGVFLVKNLK